MKPDLQTWDEFIKQYNDEMPALAHALFIQNPQGQKFMAMVLKKMYKEPVAILGQPIENATFRQGRINLMHEFENLAKIHAKGAEGNKPKVMKRELSTKKEKAK